MEDNIDFPGLRKANIDEEKIISKIQKAQRKNSKRVAKLKEADKEFAFDNFESNTSDSGIVFSRDLTENAENIKDMLHFNNLKEKEDEKPMLFFGINEHNQEKKEDNKRVDLIFLNEQENDQPDIEEQEQIESDQGIFNKSVKQEIADWIKHILIAVIIGLLLVVFVVQRNEVVGSSMEPNLMNKDQLLVQKITRLFDSGIKYGDIITIDAKGLPYHNGDNNIIKRVIGLPGDFIEIKDGYVYRNGKRVEEDYLDNVDTSERKTEYSSLLLGEDEFYLLGDNRPVSLDSRTFGPVERSRIVGEVLIRFYPLENFGKP